MDGQHLQYFKRELMNATALVHPNIVYTFGGWTDPKKGYIIMERLQNLEKSDLADSRKRLQHTYEVAAGLAYMHSRGMSHRDIKPENILKGYDGCIKLIDFGLSQIESGKASDLGAEAGTLRCMAPELFEGKGNIDAKVDVYAFAVLVYQWYTGTKAWQGQKNATIIEKVKKGCRPELGYLGNNMHHLIRHCWDQDKYSRPRMENVSFRLFYLQRHSQDASDSDSDYSGVCLLIIRGTIF